ncbi:MAG: serine/threonine-protein kinase, partial [Gammaproteobacteria bacterium]
MATVDWDRANALAQQAIDLPRTDQAQLLERLRQESAALADAVASLLHGLREPDDSTAADVDPSDGAEITPRPGERLGAYRILHSIGAGGMGSVFLAERADRAFEKQVAIKIVGRGPMDPRMAARLRGERQILASLDHPNIARLLDGGTTPDGVPYLVMEHIDGENLMAFCDGQRLTIEQRLELFLDICDAVQYAHRNLVVHRDLKPSNILVAEDGTVKLLDFGIAKMLDTNMGEQTVALTQANMVVMTPEYASPEQAVGTSITTSSDIYALGVLLYQLLAGRVPHRVSLRRPEELFRLILDVIPTPPSQRIVANEPQIDAERRYIEFNPVVIAENRGTTPEKLIRRLRGDLDYITLMALRKEPERRYPSAQQFGDDIRRHLIDMPVVAQPDSTTYRARKFVRRHWIGLGTAATLLVTAIGAAIVFALQAERISKERDVAQAERVRA